MKRLMLFMGPSPTGSNFFGGYSDSACNLTTLISRNLLHYTKNQLFDGGQAWKNKTLLQ